MSKRDRELKKNKIQNIVLLIFGILLFLVLIFFLVSTMHQQLKHNHRHGVDARHLPITSDDIVNNCIIVKNDSV